MGRDRELRLLKELFHASVGGPKAQLVSVSGIAGIGKSRLAWEFEKYIDGLAGDVFWHRGRCLSYGDGVAYWALAEMVRMRCGIVEDEEPTSALQAAGGDRPSTSATRTSGAGSSRAWPICSGSRRAPGDQENLFSAWRILFERLAEESPTVLVFEDMQWADAGLLDFLEYLLEWSRSHPLFVLRSRARSSRRSGPTWGAASAASLALPRAAAAAGDGRAARRARARPTRGSARAHPRPRRGVPLYAVETVRMLLDRGLLAREGNVYRPTGPVETLEVPETLHALDRRAPRRARRRGAALVQDGSVLGKTFTKQGLAALTGVDRGRARAAARRSCARRCSRSRPIPRSPERGQYAFLQDIVKRGRLRDALEEGAQGEAPRGRRFLESRLGGEEDEIVEVVAAHYVDAYEAAPDAADAAEIREQGREMLVRAAERAASLAANAEAQRSFERRDRAHRRSARRRRSCTSGRA